jgi:outer membrane protein OmpA-like peptidoglycan-associated protein
MGGLDLYISTLQNNAWTEAQNFGYPINSIKDDTYYVADKNEKNIRLKGWISSDRESQCCLQLYSFTKNEINRSLSGRVFICNSKKPAKNAKVNLYDETSRESITVVTDDSGRYSFNYKGYGKVKMHFDYEGYFSVSQQVADFTDNQTTILNIPEVCLTEVIMEKPIVLNQVFFKYNSSELIEESYLQLDSLYLVLNDNSNLLIEIEAHTDAIGSDEYNLKLSQERANTILQYLVKKGINNSRLVAKGYGESKPIAPNSINGKDNPEGRALNRRCSFKVIGKL